MKIPNIFFSRQFLLVLAFLPLTLMSQNASRTDSKWIHYDDVENYESWGFLTNGEIYDVMSKWDPDSLVNYEGWAIEKIRFIVVNELAVIQVKIWQGPNAGEIYSQDVPVFNVNNWTIVELDSAVVFDHTTELYFGYNVDMSGTELGGFVTATDDGPPVDGYGNLVRKQGQWLSEYNNHNLRALIVEPLIADFQADKTTACDSSAVEFTNQSTGAETFNWVFQGGTPFFSTLENPVITYNTPGSYDVTLTVSSGGQSSTELKEDYITVLEIPGPIEGEDLVCAWTEEDYSVDNNFGSMYTWEAINGDIIDGQGTSQVTVLWQDAGTGSISVQEVTLYDCQGQSGAFEITIDPCTGVGETHLQGDLQVFPNPVHGEQLNIIGLEEGTVTITILDLSGRTLLQQELMDDQSAIHIGKLSRGIYILKAAFSQRIETIKIIKD